MEYEFLYDKGRHLLAIGYNVGERRRDASYYDLLASEARLCSFVAIAQGQVPQEAWFALGRLLITAGGEPVLLSWSGSMFEYLMPLLVMPTYENTLLDQTCRAAVQRQIEYGRTRGVPWGISESCYNATDVHLNYQYRAFGVPGLGLKRGLAEDLVVAPYASALALMVAPEEACLNLQRLAGEGFEGAYGFYEAIDYTPSRLPRGQSSAVVRAFLAHHQGMSLLSLAYLLLDRPMQKRFESDPLFQATALLLQERVPKAMASYSHTAEPSGLRETPGVTEAPVRIFSSPDSAVPEVQLLSNGRYHVMVTNAGGGYSRWRDIAVTRWREDTTCDNWGTFCYIRDVTTGTFWSTAFQPTLRRPENYEAIFSEARVEFRRRDHDFDTYTEIAVSPEDDVELRRITITNHSRTRRVIDVTSYAEVVLASPAADALHPAFSNLFVQTEILHQQRAILCTRRPRSLDEHSPWMFHLMAVHGAQVEEASYETDRMRFIGRGNTIADPQAMRESAALSGSEGSVLDPIVAIRHRIALDPEESATINIVSGIGETREACLGLVEKYQDRRLADRVFDLAWTHGQVLLRQINATEADAQTLRTSGRFRGLRQLLAARRPERPRPEPARAIRSLGLLHLRRLADRAAANWRPGQHRTCPPTGTGPRLLAPEGVGGGPGDLERRSRRLPAAASRSDHGSDRRGGRSRRDRSSGRHLRETGGPDIGRGPHPVPIGRSRHPHRRPGDAGGADRAPQPLGGAVPRTEPARVPRAESPAAGAAPRNDLLFFNGLGGFTPDGREYIVTTTARQVTPAPWVNVLANPHFGSVVSESGLAYTWSENAHEFRLTPWNNDPVSDSSGEACYLRDEESGYFWSPTPLPSRGATPYVSRHGFGYSVFEHTESGIRSEVWIYVALDAPVKFTVLKVRNESGRPRRLSATGYVEWVLGDLRPKSRHARDDRDRPGQRRALRPEPVQHGVRGQSWLLRRGRCGPYRERRPD